MADYKRSQFEVLSLYVVARFQSLNDERKTIADLNKMTSINNGVYNGQTRLGFWDVFKTRNDEMSL